jgi:hypothetical protein
MKAKIIIILFFLAINAQAAMADNNLTQRLRGKILLQAEAHGEAWYVNPADEKRYYLGRPADAWRIMQTLSLGINNTDLDKIPVGLLNYQAADDDNDGLPNTLENALRTDPVKTDTDGDGYNDRLEIEKKYNARGAGGINFDLVLTDRQSGKILLQTDNAGACWYLNPGDKKRYFLGRPADAWQIMKNLALGITNEKIQQISIGNLQQADQTVPIYTPTPIPTPFSENIMDSAAAGIRANDKEIAKKYFVENMHKSLEYSMDHLSADSRLLLANILSGASLSSSTETEKKYTNKAYFSLKDTEVFLTFSVQKQSDGSWKLANL